MAGFRRFNGESIQPIAARPSESILAGRDSRGRGTKRAEALPLAPIRGGKISRRAGTAETGRERRERALGAWLGPGRGLAREGRGVGGDGSGMRGSVTEGGGVRKWTICDGATKWGENGGFWAWRADMERNIIGRNGGGGRGAVSRGVWGWGGERDGGDTDIRGDVVDGAGWGACDVYRGPGDRGGMDSDSSSGGGDRGDVDTGDQESWGACAGVASDEGGGSGEGIRLRGLWGGFWRFGARGAYGGVAPGLGGGGQGIGGGGASPRGAG